MSGGRFDGNINYWSPEKDRKVNEAGKALVVNAGAAEITNVLPVADVGGSLDGLFFVLQDEAGGVAFWIDIDNSGTTIPAGAQAIIDGGGRAIEITTIATNDSAATQQGLLVTAIGADSKFGAANGAGDSVDVTDADVGGRPDASAGDTGYTVSEGTTGITPYYIVNETSILRIIPATDTFLKFLDDFSLSVPASTADTLLKQDIEYFISSLCLKFHSKSDPSSFGSRK